MQLQQYIASCSNDTNCFVCHFSSQTATATNENNITTTQCSKEAPFDSVIYHHNRVFVVAEVDDTYVYHVHLGELHID